MPTTFTVDDNGAGDFLLISDAIAAATDGDTIIVTGGADNIHTEANIIIDKNLTIQGDDEITIDGAQAGRVFETGNIATLDVSISDVTITGGLATGSDSDDDGGAIWHRGGTLSITNSVITGNEASDDGGGIRNDGTLTITGSTLINNVSVGTSSTSGGGAIINTTGGTLTVGSSTLSENTARNGGGIRNDGELTVAYSTLNSNTATGTYGGGGLINTFVPGAAGNATIISSTISGNHAANSGGGIAVGAGLVGIRNSTIVLNTATNSGGGISTTGAVNLETSIFAGNTSAQGPDGFTTSEPLFGLNGVINGDDANLVGDLAGITNGSIGTGTDLTLAGLGVDLAGVINTTLADNGGLTKTHALTPNSPAIDAAAGESAPVFDQRGPFFLRLIGDLDIGAFEGGSFGSPTADLINGHEGNDNIRGGEGDDNIVGNGGNDRLFGEADNDTILGGDGNDIIEGGEGSDILRGGDGSDTVSYRQSSAGVDVVLFANSAIGGDANGDDIDGFERVFGSNFDDSLMGTEQSNRLNGYSGDDVISGLGGNDVIQGGGGADTLDGNNGIDTLDYRSSPEAVAVNLATGAVSGGDAFMDTIANFENVIASNYDDILEGDDGRNMLAGYDGADQLMGAGGNDLLIGGAGADLIDGGSGSDIADYRRSSAGVFVDLFNGIYTGGDAEGDMLISIEKIFGSDFDDTLVGDDNNNVLMGHAGADALFGGEGNDFLRGGAGADLLSGGDGNDVIDYRGSQSGVSINLLLNEFMGGDAEGDTVSEIERIFGSHHDDTIAGDDNNNTLFGYGGDDSLFGGLGNDTLRGGAGADLLDGNDGKDTVDYRGSAAGIVVDLSSATGSASGGDAEGDVLIAIERVTGSDFDDVITGANDSNILRGNNGNDMLAGLGGGDILRGGAGADMLLGGGGSDTFEYVAFSDSQLNGYDAIADLNANQDSIKGPSAVAAGSIMQLGPVNSLNEADIELLLDATTFVANGAATFTHGTGNNLRTFLSLNDSVSGFQASSDAVIEITGFTGSIANLEVKGL
ncbi:MAG: bluetail domain-containing putative surface protein [Cyanobacteria bacterium J06643_4]